MVLQKGGGLLSLRHLASDTQLFQSWPPRERSKGQGLGAEIPGTYRRSQSIQQAAPANETNRNGFRSTRVVIHPALANQAAVDRPILMGNYFHNCFSAG